MGVAEVCGKIKFRQRFRFIEERLKADGNSLDNATPVEMDSLWDQSKAKTA